MAFTPRAVETATAHDAIVDIVVVGGGTVGLLTALALKHADANASVVLIDARPPGPMVDGRASAIAAAARRMLTRLGVWHRVESVAQPIMSMVVTDSRLRDTVRPVFLTFGGEVEPGEAFAHMVPNDVLTDALAEAATAAGVQRIAPALVEDYVAEGPLATVHLADGRDVRTRLLIAADGVRSKLRGLAGIGVVHSDYRQSAIVTTVAHERPHEGRAVEHFLPSGPFAILPLTGNRSSLVWTETRDEAKRLLSLEEFTFEIELERRFGRELGALTLAGPRHAYPLGLTIARRFTAPRFALVGDAAHAIHPIAGQGLNMGFRDAAALAEVVTDARRLGLDPGAADVLESYAKWRRFDTIEMGATTDILNRLFRTDIEAVRVVRDIGLGLVDRMPMLKRHFIREAAGLGGSVPRLMRGEAI